MDCHTVPKNATDPAPTTDEDKKLKNSESAENFQHFIYELFEKNGILNDLRAYLRGHIVEVLKKAQSGSPLTCQKHFTQRLELANQALNMLVAEYLLRYDFSYSLSVFVSEIPLANMVFGLAKTLMTQTDNSDNTKLWFSESDVWLALNYLGIKCDSEHASNIVEKYQKKESPLLLCMLKCLPFYCKQDMAQELRNSSMESLTSEKSSESVPEKQAKYQKPHEKCKHYAHCKSCQCRLHSIKEKYVKKKKYLKKNTSIIADTQNTENLMKNVGFIEKALVDEMFLQLKNVYETEVEMVKEEEEKKYKQVLAAYAEQLQQRQTEMEESYKQREEDLVKAVQQKKKFLWGLAQSLRDQHQTMAAAMSCVKGESERLSAKEDNLKTQLLEAENVIKNRGEEMRDQISKEILVLEAHLEAMKKERESIDKEKSDLENFKTLCESKVKLITNDSQLDSLKKEIITLKKYVEAKKCVAEKHTMTDADGGGRMNNQDVVGAKSDSEERVGRTPNQLVNDLKKQKNVNFSQSQLDMMYQDSHRDRVRSLSTDGFDEREARRDAILLLQDENDRLKHFARQQEQHIDELTIQTARLQAELEAARLRHERPRTAPTLPTNYEMPTNFEPRLNSTLSVTYDGFSRRLGAGEDSLGVRAARDRRADNRRYLVQQWRALRRSSPMCARRASGTHPQPGVFPTVSELSASHPVDSEPMRETVDENDYRIQQDVSCDQDAKVDRQMAPESPEENKPTAKNLKNVLKEAKQKLRNKDVPKNHPQSKREKSPNSVLREAKLRLRKLEIEAEAVEKSYMDFRQRQNMREETRQYVHVPDTGALFVNEPTVNEVILDGKRCPSLFREGTRDDNTSDLQKCKRNLDKFLTNYETKFNAANSDFRIKSAKEKLQVIPQSFIEIDKENVAKKDNTYLETPLIEFRKLYSQHSAPSRYEQSKAKQTLEETRAKIKDRNEIDKNETKQRRPKDEKQELQILKENINKIYNLQEERNAEQIEEVKSEESQNVNLLRIEVECVTKTDNLKLKKSPQDLMLVVQSTADSKNISDSDLEDVSPQMTVIVSPKLRGSTDNIDAKSQDPSSTTPQLEEPEKLTRDLLDTIYHIDAVPKQIQGGSQEFESLSSRDKADDYIDDFSADVDNYNSRSEYDDNSPISHLKTSEDENFWDN